MRLVQRAQQRRRVRLERGGRRRQGLLIVLRQLLADLFVAAQRAVPAVRHAVGGGFHAGRHGFQHAGLRGGLGIDVAHGLGQGVADGLLAVGGLRAGLFPFLAQRGAHGAQGLGPRRQALLIARGQVRLQERVRIVQRAQQRRRVLFETGGGGGQRLQVVARQLFADALLARQRGSPGLGHIARRRLKACGHAVQQRGRALFEGFGKAVHRGTQVLRQRFACALLAGQRLVPDVGHVGGGRLEARGQAVQLLLYGLRHRVLQAGGFARQAFHRGLHDRLQGHPGGTRAFGHAFLHGLFHHRRQPGVGRLGLALKGVLAGQLAVIDGARLLLHVLHHGLQAVNQRRHGLGLALHDFGLALQQLEGFFALIALRIHAQGRGDLAVQHLRGLHPFAAAQRGQEAQHGGRRHPGNRRAERKTQALDRRGERRAYGAQVGRAFQCDAGAAQRYNHAQECAQHAQQHQQANQIGRQGRAGQAHPFAFHAQARGVAQAGVQLVQPGSQAGGRFGQRGGGPRQAGRGLLITQQFPGTGQVTDAYQQRHGQR
ncbi:hypothetical protein D3C85_785080 [compost metagenome]